MTQSQPDFNPAYGQPAHQQAYRDTRGEQPAYPPGSPEYSSVYGAPTPTASAPVTPVAPTPFRPVKKRRGRTALILTVVAVVAVLCGGGALAAVIAGTSGSSPASSPSTATAGAAAPAVAGKTSPTVAAKPAVATIAAESTLLVPSQVKPGTYQAHVPKDSYGCYWARLDGPDTADIITNGNVAPGGTATVKILKTDKAFQSMGCGEWTWAKTQ